MIPGVALQPLHYLPRQVRRVATSRPSSAAVPQSQTRERDERTAQRAAGADPSPDAGGVQAFQCRRRREAAGADRAPAPLLNFKPVSYNHPVSCMYGGGNMAE